MKKIACLLCCILFLTACGAGQNVSGGGEAGFSHEHSQMPSQTPESSAAPTQAPTESPSAASTQAPTQVPAQSPAAQAPAASPASQFTKEEISQKSNKTVGWGLRKIPGSRPEFGSSVEETMKKYGCMYVGSDQQPVLYLTFDEGYENGYTASILDTLKKTGVKAAFFITGPYLKNSRDLVDRMVAEGHIVGNHTINHPSLPSVSPEEMEQEVLGLDKQFYDIYGKHMTYIRPPKGEYSERTLAVSKSLGYTDVFWSFAYKDWETDNQKGADYAYEEVMKNLHNGAILLLHAVSKDNAEALERIIDNARANGYSFKNLDEFVY